MLSVSPPRTAADAVSYYLHLQERGHNLAEDYYAKEGAGVWLGEGAQALGLSGDVSAADFEALANGFALDGSKLVQNAGDPDRRAGWDLTFSAPKSVSVVWGLADKDIASRIEAAHAKAVSAAMLFMQDKAGFVRVGKEGAVNEPARLVAAMFQHGTSREGDMQLHTHGFVFNQGLRENGEWAALDSSGFYTWKMAAGAAYRAEFSHELRQDGFEIERDGESFRLVGVPQDVDAHFSQRREQILEAMRAEGYYSAKAAEIAALDTREAKKDLTADDLRPEWRARAEAMGFTFDRAEALAKNTPAAALQAPSADEILRLATEHEAVLRPQDLAVAAFQAAQGVSGYEGAKDILAGVLDKAVVLADDKGRLHFSTQELVEKERRTFEDSIARRGERNHQLPTERIDASIAAFEARKTEELRAAGVLGPDDAYRLKPEQANAVRYLVGDSGAVAFLIGDAGTGKTTALEAVREAYEAAGFRVVGAALGGKAAAGLEAEAGIQSATIARTLIDIERGAIKLDTTTVLVIDEAGMVDSRNAYKLTQLANEAGAKIINAGDAKQLQAVGAGTSFRHLAEPSACGSARLSDITRQHDERDRAAVKALADGDVEKAFDSFIERGKVTIVGTNDQAYRECARLAVAASAGRDMSQILLPAATNADARNLNAAVRDALKAEGRLTSAVRVETQTDFGERNIEVAAADRVLFVKNDRETGLRNGDFATVVAVEKRGDGANVLRIHVDRTKEEILVSPDKLHIRHGYAATVHRAQGVSVAVTPIKLDHHSYREQVYVAMSRFRESAQVVMTAHSIKELARAQGKEIEIEIPKGASAAERAEAYKVALRTTLAELAKSAEKKSTLDLVRAGQGAADKVKAEALRFRTVQEPIKENMNDGQIRTQQPNAGRDYGHDTAGPAASVRDLPGRDLAHNRDGAQVLLHRDAHHHVAKDREADTSLRRSGAGDRARDRTHEGRSAERPHIKNAREIAASTRPPVSVPTVDKGRIAEIVAKAPEIDLSRLPQEPNLAPIDTHAPSLPPASPERAPVRERDFGLDW